MVKVKNNKASKKARKTPVKKAPAPRPPAGPSVKFRIHCLKRASTVYEFGAKDAFGRVAAVTVPMGAFLSHRVYTVPAADRVYHTVFLVWGRRPDCRVFSNTRATTLDGTPVPCDKDCMHAPVVLRVRTDKE